MSFKGNPALTPRTQRAADNKRRAEVLGRVLYDTTYQQYDRTRRLQSLNGCTNLATKYSHPRGKIGSVNHKPIKGSGKSGLTPLLAPQNGTSINKRQRLKEYQRKRLKGFTTAELQRMEALAPLDDEIWKHRLNNPIHPIFNGRWVKEVDMPRHWGAIPMLGDYDGLWLMENPIVEKMRPVLQLASRMLVNECQYSWLDALFSGRYEAFEHPDPEERAKDNNRLQRFYKRSQLERFNFTETQETQALLDMQHNIDKVAEMLQISFSSGYEDPSIGLPCTNINKNGQTLENTHHNRVEIHISIELAQPLLRNDLMTAEIMGFRFRLSTTLMHEFAHAAWKTIELLALGPASRLREEILTEPYHENEPLSELGYSFSSQFWGGFFKNSFFTARNAKYGTSRGAPSLPQVVEDGELDPFFTYDFWTIPTKWYGVLFDEDLWEVEMRRMGKNAVKMGPLKFGTRTTQQDPAVTKIALDQDGEIVQVHSFEESAIQTGSTGPERVTQQSENARKSQGQNIREAMRMQPSPPAVSPEHEHSDESLEGDIQMKVPEYPVTVLPSCPRYEEVKKYLFANRDPLQLALDTMGKIPETTFYRYIRDRGRIEISAHELRDFLHMASDRRELFFWEPFPGSGTLTRIPAGWASHTASPISPPLNPADDETINQLDILMGDTEFREKLYQYTLEMWDLDIEYFRIWLLATDGDEMWDVEREEFESVVVESVVLGSAYFTLGPKGIIRFFTPENIDDIRAKYASRFVMNRFEAL